MNLRSQEGLHKFVCENEGNVAFLRFQRAGLKQGKYSDWDIAVRDRELAIKQCEILFENPLLRIPRQYVVQHFYDWGQCDLLPVLEWNGIEYQNADRFWEGVEKGDDGIPRPALGHDAYVAWMTGLLWGRRFDRRYRELITRAASEDEGHFRQSLDTAFGKSLGGKLYRIAVRGDAGVATHWVTRMRFCLFFRRMRKAPMDTVRQIVGHWHCEWRFHRRLALPWIGLLGPDGSGKSTVIEMLTERLKLSRLKLRTIHWLPNLSLDQVPERENQVVTDPHSQPSKSPLLSILQLCKLLFFWWFASFRYLIHLRAKKEIVLSDRFYSDLLADPKRYRYGANRKWARVFFRCFPKPDKVIVLLTSADKILERKQEVEKSELERQLVRYQQVARNWGDRGVIINCGESPEKVVDQVFKVFCEALNERSR